MREIWWDRAIKTIRLSQRVDWMFSIFSKLRSELVLGMASDEFLDKYNDMAYGSLEPYRAGASNYRNKLFLWEEQMIAKYFPAPPARLLVGGAGGGREAFALAKLGYEVIAFDPSKTLVQGMARGVPAGLRVKVFRAAYEDLPTLFAAEGNVPLEYLGRLGVFDAAIMGWGSLSHIRSERRRIQAVKAFGEVTRGPILISFLSRPDAANAGPLRPIRSRVLSRGLHADRGDWFWPGVGYVHLFSTDEIVYLTERAHVDVVHCYIAEPDYSHAVLMPRSRHGIESE